MKDREPRINSGLFPVPSRGPLDWFGWLSQRLEDFERRLQRRKANRIWQKREREREAFARSRDQHNRPS